MSNTSEKAYTINGLTDQLMQSNSIQLPTGDTLTLTLSFARNRWIMDVDYKDFAIHCMRLVTTPNILTPYAYAFPFGLQVYSKDKGDPYFIDDFISGRIIMQIVDLKETHD